MENKKQKALIVAFNDLNNSGVPNVIYQTIKSLYKSYDFDIISFGTNNFYAEQLKNSGINNFRIIYFKDNVPKTLLKKIFWILISRNRSFYKHSLKIMKNSNYKVLHCFKEYDSWPFLKAGKKLGIKKRILHCNVDHSEKQNFKGTLITLFSKTKALHYANTLISVTQKSAVSAFGKKDFLVLYNTYDEHLYNRNIAKKKTAQLIITQIGSFCRNKNQLFSIHLLNELLKRGVDCRLQFVGKELEEGYYSKMKELIACLKLNKYILFLSEKDNVINSLKNTTFTIIPSFYEGASIVAIESQACEIPCFASKAVSQELNCGGLISFDINDGEKSVADLILSIFNKGFNCSKTYYDLKRFSNNVFKTQISSIYE